MKKQILILLIAFLASATVVFAQAPNLGGVATCPVPTAVTCLTSDALHPVPGTDYDYTVIVPTPATGTKTYNWFVTQDPQFIVGSTLTTAIEANDGTGAHIQATGAGYNDTPAGSGTATMNITWKSFTHDPLLPVFLVIYVQNDACATDNIQVYIIQPVHSFTLDIANIAIDGSAQANLYETCVAPVAGAVYNTTSGIVEMDYGVNYLFFAVTAANYTDSWLASFLIGGTGIAGSREVTAVDWAYPAAAQTGTWNTTTGSGVNWVADNPVEAQAGTTVGAAGECIIVRVTVANNQAETIVNAPISLAVDGVMLDPVNNNYTNTTAFGDIHYEAGGTPSTCPWFDGFTNDVITQVLAPRPDINEVTPTPFVPTNRD